MYTGHEHHHSSQSHHHGHVPSYYGHGHGHFSQGPTVVVSDPYPSGYHHHGHFYRGSRWGIGATIITGLIVIPIVIVAMIANSTVSVSAASMATTGAFGATATGSALALSAAATFGLGALIAYGVIGIGFLYSSANECYNSNKNVIDMIKSRVANEDGLSFKGVIKSIGAVLWSPFLLVGGLAGMGAKAAVAVYHRSKSSVPAQVEGEQQITTSHVQMGTDLAPRKDGKEVDSANEPVQLRTLFAGSLKNSTQKSEEMLDELNSSTLGLQNSSSNP
jgi:hypothetical protein